MRMASVTRSAGVKNLPMRSTSFEGDDESQKAIPRKIARKTGSAKAEGSAPKKGRTAISKETVPVRGMAKQGPIAM